MNIQQTIIEGLRQQLYHHQYIVLPEFGGFVLKPRPAHFSPSGQSLIPPSKSVSFNSQLKQNDGILTAWLQKKAGCSTEEAYHHLKDFSGYCTGVLQNRRRLSLPGIGFFHLDFENNVCFEPLADQNFLSSSFGLTPISIARETETLPPPVRRHVFEDRVVSSAPIKRNAGARLRLAVVPVLLTTCVAVLLLLLVSVSSFRGELRAALSGTGSEAHYTARKYDPLKLVKPETTAALISDANGIAMFKLDEKNIPVHVTAAGNVSEKNYEIILGCFAVPGNAKKMLRQLSRKDIRASISGQKHRGMAVVVYGSFENKEEAQLALTSIKEVVPEAWIKPR